ncbi:MAG: fused MFS/spermidine synthase [Betaproteobacteria bacterium]|nr:fused MFS/spermidine synthase [Betaproteobacteria bacterium]
MLLFALTIFLSAFLLFQIQPMVAKMILPWFGGASSVWSVCLLFFQSVLLLGYLYAHALHETLAPRRQAAVHIALLLASLWLLPVGADPSWKGAALDSPALGVLGVLAAAVGLPYLLLSTTGPLMQAWYARAFTGVMPYRLYALSNFASMLALLSYPVLVEPFLELQGQAWAWSAGYAAFVAACCVTAGWSWRQAGDARPGDPTRADAAARPGIAQCLIWIGLAMAATTLLLAMTRHLTQDVAPVPFLWVLPLAIYLLSFILCFEAPRFYWRPVFLGALPAAFFGLDWIMTRGLPVPAMVALIGATLFVICMVCHGELVRLKPPPRHLTLFYLMLSLGGALGGLFVGLLAPAIFNAYFEFPLGLFLCALLVVVVLWKPLRWPWRVLLLGALLAYGLRLGYQARELVQNYQVAVRNFYGQLRVSERDDGGPGPKRILAHGRITHGWQFLADEHRRTPTSYYCAESGIGRALSSFPEDTPRKLGMVGLGTGTLAAYTRAGDALRIYEINEQVLDLARREFTFLDQSPAPITPVLGDGRLMLEREAPQGFDLLALDAFSGDSIPTHLVTLEAFEVYLKHLKPEGILAVHTSNAYLDLPPVVARAAEHFGKAAVLYAYVQGDEEKVCYTSDWVLVMSPERAANLPAGMLPADLITAKAGFRPWTDGYSNLFRVMK